MFPTPVARRREEKDIISDKVRLLDQAESELLFS